LYDAGASATRLAIDNAGAVTIAGTLGAGATTVTTLVTSGNMGIKVTPETWFASYAVEQLGGNAFLASTTTPAASNDFLIGLNAYLSAGGSWTKISDDEASRYYQQNGSHVFQSAASGTGTFSWTTAANFDISGMNGVLGATTPAAATVTTLTTGGQLNARQGSVGVGSHSILLGADVNATTVTNVTRKIGIISTPHYTIAEEPVGGLYTDVDNGTNAVNIGGGYSTLNAATTVRIYAAADATTQTGTSVALFDVSGMNGVLGATTPAAATVTTLGASGNITSSNGVLSMTKSQDAASGHILLNNNSHTTASSYLRMQSNAASAYLFAFSTAYTTSARAIADGVLLVADVNSAGGLALASDHATADISFWTNNTQKMTIDGATGNVGIGTASPQALLHVGAGADAPNIGDPLYISNAGNTSLEVRDSTNDISTWVAAHSGLGIIGTRTNHSLALQTNSATVATFDSSGNLGIGVTPQATWHGDVSAYQIGGNATMWANTSAGAGTAFSIAQNAFYNSSNNPTYISNDEASYYNQVNGTHAFYTAGASTGTITWGTAKLTIANDGSISSATAAAQRAIAAVNSHATTPYGISIDFTGWNGGDTTQWFFYAANSDTSKAAIVYSDGSFQGTANSYGGISDVALKSNITPARDYWDDWKKLKYSKWQWTNEYEKEGDEAKTLFGIVAQDLAEVFPGCTYDTDEGLAVRTSVVNTIGGRVLQRAQERIEDVEGAVMKSVLDWKAEAKALRAELNALKKQMAA
jgi:hypothetical protein